MRRARPRSRCPQVRLPFHYMLNDFLLPHFNGRPPPPAVLEAYKRAKQALGLAELQPFPVRHI